VIKERLIAREYLAINDRQITIAHSTMKVHYIAINFFSKRERQMTSNYLVMLVMFAHLAIIELQIVSNFFSKRECQLTTAISYVCLMFMFYHSIHGTFKFTEYSVYVPSHTYDI
jgi:hypothetical protein